MTSIQYSSNCYYKNDLYRLSIVVNHGDNVDCISEESDEDIETDISREEIKSTLTQINFELIDSHKKVSALPKTIRLGQLLNVIYVKSVRTYPYIQKFNSFDTINSKKLSREKIENSQETLYTTLNMSRSEVNVTQSISMDRQFSWGTFISRQNTINNDHDDFNRKSSVRLNYVDVSNSIQWNIKKLEFEFDTDAMAVDLYRNLNFHLTTLTERPRYLLVFVNPCCGKGRARYLYEKKILPIFHRAAIRVETIYTERANHARDYILNEDLQGYDGLISVGGDGMFAELCHGLFLRTCREANLNIDDPQVNLIQPKLRIGIIPAGSTDAIAFGTTGLNDPLTSALQIIVGESLSIDISTIHNEKGFVRFMAAMLAYGYFGDIIKQSDKWRCLGPLRYDVSGVFRFLRNKSYETEVTMTLANSDSSTASTLINGGIAGERISSMNSNDISSESKHPIDTLVKKTKSMILPALVFCSKNCETCALKEHDDEIMRQTPSTITFEGKYTAVNCLNMPCRCAKSPFGMSPFVHLGDGSFDLLLIKRSWQPAFLRFLWQVARDGRSIEDLPNVERYRVNEVLIRPKSFEHGKAGAWACDGEAVEGREIRIRVHRQALKLFASGIHFETLEDYRPMKQQKATNKRRNCCFSFRKRKAT